MLSPMQTYGGASRGTCRDLQPKRSVAANWFRRRGYLGSLGRSKKLRAPTVQLHRNSDHGKTVVFRRVEVWPGAITGAQSEILAQNDTTVTGE